MSKKNPVHAIAVATIAETVREKYAELEKAFQNMVAQETDEVRKSLLSGIEKESTLYPIAQFVASQTKIVLRENDKYPAMEMSSEAQIIVQDAINAGLINCTLGDKEVNKDGRLVYSSNDKSYKAWSNLKDYKEKNKKYLSNS